MITQRKHQEVLERERDYWQGVVTALLNRIQAPQIAVAQSTPSPADEPPAYVSSTDDEALAAYEELRRKLVVPE